MEAHRQDVAFPTEEKTSVRGRGERDRESKSSLSGCTRAAWIGEV